MQLIEITAEVLRRAAEEAINQGEQGLIVWSGYDKWRYLNGKISSGTPAYKRAMEFVTKGQSYWIRLDGCGNLLESTESNHEDIKILVIPAEVAVDSHNYCRRTASNLRFMEVRGPISMLPSTNLSPVYFN
ncbi:MAG: hypothetical protein HFJ54_04575 [Clostridia bacterium]|nr:hypothetical protein [Clostridia bacterium]